MSAPPEARSDAPADGRRAKLKLSSGREIEADLPDGMAASGVVTAVVRPEHATLAEGSNSGCELEGRLENIVYIGTDTHYHVRLSDNSPFVVRSQNLRANAETFRTDQSVGIVFKRDAVQVLRD